MLGVCNFLAKKSITKMNHSPYSPKFAHWKSWLFPKLKNSLTGQKFTDISNMCKLHEKIAQNCNCCYNKPNYYFKYYDNINIAIILNK